MNKYLGIILILLGLFSLSLANHADEYGCVTYGAEFCEECADGYVLENYACVPCTLYNGEGCCLCSDIYSCDVCFDGWTLEDGACVGGSSDED